MNETPRPMTLGEILDRTAHFYRSRFLVFFGISVIPTGVMVVLALGVFVFLVWWNDGGAGGASKETSELIAGAFVGGVVLLALPLMLVLTSLAEAAMTHAVNQAWYGEKTSIRAAYAAIWPRGWRYIWLYLLRAVAEWGPPVVAYFLIVALAMLAATMGGAGFSIWILILLVVVALIGYIVWMALQLSLAFPASVVEQSKAWEAVKRSVALSRGSRARIFLLYLLGWVMQTVLSGGLMMLVTIAMALLPWARNPNPQRAQAMGMIVVFVAYGGGFAMQALIKPLYEIALLLFYYDQRIRLEGYDIEWMMQQAGLAAPVAMPAGPPSQEMAVAVVQTVGGDATGSVAASAAVREESQ